MKNRKTNVLLKVILVCVSLVLAFGAGIYVTSLLEPKADTVQNKTDNEKEMTDGGNESVTSSGESSTDEDDYELPIVDADSSADTSRFHPMMWKWIFPDMNRSKHRNLFLRIRNIRLTLLKHGKRRMTNCRKCRYILPRKLLKSPLRALYNQILWKRLR